MSSWLGYSSPPPSPIELGCSKGIAGGEGSDVGAVEVDEWNGRVCGYFFKKNSREGSQAAAPVSPFVEASVVGVGSCDCGGYHLPCDSTVSPGPFRLLPLFFSYHPLI